MFKKTTSSNKTQYATFLDTGKVHSWSADHSDLINVKWKYPLEFIVMSYFDVFSATVFIFAKKKKIYGRPVLLIIIWFKKKKEITECFAEGHSAE